MPVFCSEVYHVPSDAVLQVEVEYEMRDCGVMMQRNENVQPVILSVRAAGEELLDGIDDDDLVRLRREAREDDELITELNREIRRDHL